MNFINKVKSRQEIFWELFLVRTNNNKNTYKYMYLIKA